GVAIARRAIPGGGLQDKPPGRYGRRLQLSPSDRGDAAFGLSAAGAVVYRGTASLSAVATAWLRSAPAFRRGGVPVPAGHVRCRHPGRRRPPGRRVRLEPAAGIGGGAVRSTRPGAACGMTTTAVEIAIAATGLLQAFNAAGILDISDVQVAQRLC